jgi:hypothetical protein
MKAKPSTRPMVKIGRASSTRVSQSVVKNSLMLTPRMNALITAASRMEVPVADSTSNL